MRKWCNSAVTGSLARIVTCKKEGGINPRAMVYSNQLARYNAAGIATARYARMLDEKNKAFVIAERFHPRDRVNHISATINFISSAKNATRMEETKMLDWTV